MYYAEICPYRGCGSELDEVQHREVYRIDTSALAKEHFVPNFELIESIKSGGSF
jgi:hypothetical protein